MKFNPKYSISDQSVSILIMVWRGTGNKPNLNQWWQSLLTHMCVAWLQCIHHTAIPNSVYWFVFNKYVFGRFRSVNLNMPQLWVRFPLYYYHVYDHSMTQLITNWFFYRILLSNTYASVNCVGLASCNGLLPVRRQAFTRINAYVLSIGPLGTNFIEILIKIQNLTFMKFHVKISSEKCRPFCSGGDELNEKKYLWLNLEISTNRLESKESQI